MFFLVFDKNGDGKITRNELRKVMKDLGDKMTKAGKIEWYIILYIPTWLLETEAMIAASDEDGDGKVDYEEFVQMMMA